MNLVPLFEEALEFQDYNGTVLSDGKVAVYYIGRTRLADIYEDVAAEYPAENPRILNNLGMGPVYVNPAFDYEMVVFDAYGSELFSVKKYLASKGEHSTANVVVTPSESIAVSAWTVGDVQVYMPYLTGQLGKVYTGIEPIVVNNVEDKISANHVPLGVQDPLYFVQDDEEACIIGLSGGVVPEGTMNESAFGYQDGQITSYNGSAFSAGNSYEAGSYVDITNNTISITGLTPVPADTASTGLVAQVSADITAMIPDVSDMATQTWVNEQGFLTAHQDISNKLDTTAFSTVSGDFITAIPSEYVTENTLQSGLSSILDSTAFSTVSGDFLTAHQSLDGLMSASLLEQSGGLITGYNGTAFAGQGGGGVTGDYTLVEGNGIKLTDDPIAQTTTISVSGDYATNTQLQNVSADITAMIPTALTGDYLDKASADTLYYPLESNPNGYLTAETDWTNTITAASANAYNEATAAIPTGLATTGDLANVSADITAQIPTDLFTKASAETLYQPIGDYLTTGDSAEFMTTAERSDYIPTGVSSEFYTTANESGFITAVPDTYLQNTDLTITDNKVTEISGIPLSAGTELEFEYDAADNISAINSSAISTTPAQALYAQNPLYFSATGASSYMGINSADLARMLGVDETVLWEGNIPMTSGSTARCSESIYNFNKIKFLYNGSADGEYQQNSNYIVETDQTSATNRISWEDGFTIGNNWYNRYFNRFTISNGTDLTLTNATCYWGQTAHAGYSLTGHGGSFYKIIGIGRKEV